MFDPVRDLIVCISLSITIAISMREASQPNRPPLDKWLYRAAACAAALALMVLLGSMQGPPLVCRLHP